MRKLLISYRQTFTTYLFCVFYIFFIMLIIGCGGGTDDNISHESSETGSAVFTVAWHDDHVIQASANALVTTATAQAVPVDCNNINDVICEVYDEYGTFLTSESFPCTQGNGIVNNIPIGNNRNFIIRAVAYGAQNEEYTFFRGETGNKVTIQANQTVDAGKIDAYPYDNVNGLGMTFRAIPVGTFTMGSPIDYGVKTYFDEQQHGVILTNPFYMQTTEVTQAQWVAVMKSNPSYNNSCNNCPVESMTFADIQLFITELNKRNEGTYRLPTEAEWEYAARAGSITDFANGDLTMAFNSTVCEQEPTLDVIGWYCFNSNNTSHVVAQKNPNAWGLYDMHGNVWEWCSDWYAADYYYNYPPYPQIDPQGPSRGTIHVARGGSFNHPAIRCRSAHRGGSPTGGNDPYTGFRLVLEPNP